MKSIGVDVFLKGKQIDTVFFDANMTIRECYDSLVNHDGYNPGIVVQAGRLWYPRIGKQGADEKIG